MSEQHLPVGRRVIDVLKQLAERVLTGLGLLRERTATRVKCLFETHKPIDPADHRLNNAMDDRAEYPRRYLARLCPRRSGK